MYVSESWGMKEYKKLFGTDYIDPLNGYYHGKRWFNVTLAAWKEDIPRKLLFVEDFINELDKSEDKE